MVPTNKLSVTTNSTHECGPILPLPLPLIRYFCNYTNTSSLISPFPLEVKISKRVEPGLAPLLHLFFPPFPAPSLILFFSLPPI